MSTVLPGPFRRWGPGTLLALLVSAAAAGTGVALTALASLFGTAAPLVLVGLAVFPLLLIGILQEPLAGVATVFATFPAGTLAIPAGLLSLQAPEAAVIMVAIVVILRRLAAAATPLPWAPSLWWLLGLLGWSVLAAPSALDTSLALKSVASLAGGIAFLCVVLDACRDLTDVRRAMAALTLIATGIAAYALLTGGEARALYGGTIISGRIEGTFTQPNQLGSFAGLSAFVAAGLALGARSPAGRVFAGIALAIQLGALLFSLSRGAWIGTVIGMGFLILTLPQARRAVAVLSVPLVLIAAAVGAFAPTNPQVEVVGARIASLTDVGPYDSRTTVWNEAVREIQEDPWTGQGPGNFPVASARAASESRTVSADHAHNLLLNWAAEAGLPAAGLIVGFSVALALTGRKAKRGLPPADRPLVACLGAALLSLVGQGLVDYTLPVVPIFLTVMAVTGMMLACRRISLAPAS